MRRNLLRWLKPICSVWLLLASITQSPSAQTLQIEGEPEKSADEIVGVRDANGRLCAAIQVLSNMDGFSYDSYNGVVKVEDKPGKDMVFLQPDERVLEIYHTGYEPLKIILSEIGIQLKSKEVWRLKIAGEKNIPIVIIVQPEDAEIFIDNRSMGTGKQHSVSVGTHQLRMVKEGYRDILDTINVDEQHTIFEYTLVKEILLVSVKGGTFQMGDQFGDGGSDQRPVHTVTVSDFYIGATEVTNAQFCEFLNDYGSDKVKSGAYRGQQMIYEHEWNVKRSGSQWKPQAGYENHPVVVVTWYGANAFCEWAGGRLPTEAEWEYAARSGGKKEKWAGTSSESSLGSYAWYSSNAGGKMHPVGQKQPNGLGLYDMSGNVYEWCSDWYGSYPSGSVTNPTGPSSGADRVIRGGSWYGDPRVVRCAYRCHVSPNYGFGSFGFRLCKSP